MKDEKLYRRYTVRLFPTPEQEELMWKHVHATRYVWNYMLDLQIGRRINNRKFLSSYDMNYDLKYMKMQQEMEWLKEVSNASLVIVCRDLEFAYKQFFNKKSRFPKHKSRKNKVSYPLAQDIVATHFVSNNEIVIPKVGHVLCRADIDYRVDKKTKVKDARVQYIKSSKEWILSFVLECDKQARELSDKSMGIDLGVKELAVAAVGDKKLVFHNINKSKRMRALEKKKKHIKRAIDRKYRTFNGFRTPQKGQTWEKSSNIEKYEQILREIEAKMSNVRKNYIHQITRELVNMLPERVVMEDLNVQNMLKNKHLAKSISEQNFYFFIQCMKYKCEEYGIEFVQVPMFYPSSKLCSCCGYKNKSLKLKDREWTCPNCGTHHDRDYNAAVNLMNYTENTTDKLVTKVERKPRKKKAATMTNISVD